MISSLHYIKSDDLCHKQPKWCFTKGWKIRKTQKRLMFSKCPYKLTSKTCSYSFMYSIQNPTLKTPRKN